MASGTATCEPTPVGRGDQALAGALHWEAITMTSDTIVIDHDPKWSALSSGWTRVTAAAPESAESLEGMRAMLVVNLSTPGALDAIARLQRHSKVWGVLDALKREHCVPLGQVVVAQSGHEVPTLRAIIPHSGRRRPTVLILGGDVDPTMTLWAALTRQGLSVTIVWDSTQAIEMLEIVSPDAVVVGAGGLPRGGFGFVERLPLMRRPPTVVLLPGSAPEQLANAFRVPRSYTTSMPRRLALEHFARRAPASAAGLASTVKVLAATLAA